MADKKNVVAGLFWKNVCSAIQVSELVGLCGLKKLECINV